MIEKRKLKSIGGEVRLESLKNRGEEIILSVAAKVYLNSIALPI